MSLFLRNIKFAFLSSLFIAFHRFSSFNFIIIITTTNIKNSNFKNNLQAAVFFFVVFFVFFLE